MCGKEIITFHELLLLSSLKSMLDLFKVKLYFWSPFYKKILI